MDLDKLRTHIHNEFPEEIFSHCVGIIDNILTQYQIIDQIKEKLHDSVIEEGDNYPDTDPYAVLGWCLAENRLVTYEEWRQRIYAE